MENQEQNTNEKIVQKDEAPRAYACGISKYFGEISPNPVEREEADKSTQSLKNRIGRVLFSLARSDVSQLFIGFSFEHLSSLMPVKRILDNKQVIAFQHPVKHWEQHSLLVPKKAIRNLTSVNFEDQNLQDVFLSLFQAAQEIIQINEIKSFALLVNGGKYQDIPQIHFHLASGISKDGIPLIQKDYMPSKGDIIRSTNTLDIHYNATPQREVDILLIPKNLQIQTFSGFDLSQSVNRLRLISVLSETQNLIREFKLGAYTLLIKSSDITNTSEMVFRLVSGGRI